MDPERVCTTVVTAGLRSYHRYMLFLYLLSPDGATADSKVIS